MFPFDVLFLLFIRFIKFELLTDGESASASRGLEP